MGKKAVKEKTPLDLQFSQVMSRISGWEKDLKSGSQIGPLILLFLGALVTTAGFFSIFFSDRSLPGVIAGIMGILIIIIAWIWSGKRSKGEKDIDDKILNLKGELSILEKER
jgi:hypothetical protein